MSFQIFGTKKCRDTQKAERFFKERGIAYHFVDLAEKGISPGELASIQSAAGKEELIDREGKEFEKTNLKFMAFDPREEILKNPLLLRIPIVRNGKKAVIGLKPEIWKRWITEEI